MVSKTKTCHDGGCVGSLAAGADTHYSMQLTEGYLRPQLRTQLRDDGGAGREMWRGIIKKRERKRRESIPRADVPPIDSARAPVPRIHHSRTFHFTLSHAPPHVTSYTYCILQL